MIKKRMAERGLDGIAISPLNASIQANLLADAAANKTLVTLDSDAPVTGRLLFVGLATGYILVGARLEEHDLRGQLGEPYQRYLDRTPRFVPRLPVGRQAVTEDATTN